MNLKELKNEMTNLRWEIDALIKAAKFCNYEDLSGLTDVDWDDPEDIFLIENFRYTLSKLEDVNQTLKYMSKSIKSTGRLHKNRSGRYELNGYEFHCGYGIEALIDGPGDGKKKWITSTLEHDMDRFYIVGYKDVELENLLVRIR